MEKNKCTKWMTRGDTACRNCANGCNTRPADPEFDSEAEYEAENPAPTTGDTDEETDEDAGQWYDVTVERRETAVKSHVFRVKARDEDEARDIAGDESCEFDWGDEDPYDWDDTDEIADVVESDDQEDE